MSELDEQGIGLGEIDGGEGDDVEWPEPADEPEQEPVEPWAVDDE